MTSRVVLVLACLLLVGCGGPPAAVPTRSSAPPSTLVAPPVTNPVTFGGWVDDPCALVTDPLPQTDLRVGVEGEYPVAERHGTAGCRWTWPKARIRMDVELVARDVLGERYREAEAGLEWMPFKATFGYPALQHMIDANRCSWTIGTAVDQGVVITQTTEDPYSPYALCDSAGWFESRVLKSIVESPR